jgi:hypothetical protein
MPLSGGIRDLDGELEIEIKEKFDGHSPQYCGRDRKGNPGICEANEDHD